MSNQASCVNLKSDQIGEFSSISNVTEGGVNGRRLRDGSTEASTDGRIFMVSSHTHSRERLVAVVYSDSTYNHDHPEPKITHTCSSNYGGQSHDVDPSSYSSYGQPRVKDLGMFNTHQLPCTPYPNFFSFITNPSQ
ncbi:hypothetical protein I312_104020 [Cryptococcus bacillisporus CA1280]|uniref:uncharacterized protein n=1 Tax=Cryptococcus bacillisporus CA1280 TaxID=1296109 RepID=UPI00336879B1